MSILNKFIFSKNIWLVCEIISIDEHVRTHYYNIKKEVKKSTPYLPLFLSCIWIFSLSNILFTKKRKEKRNQIKSSLNLIGFSFLWVKEQHHTFAGYFPLLTFLQPHPNIFTKIINTTSNFLLTIRKFRFKLWPFHQKTIHIYLTTVKYQTNAIRRWRLS